jgi:hypothetical protein
VLRAPGSGGSNLAPGPLGSMTPTGAGAGSSAPPPYRRLAAGGLRPSVFPAHGPAPQLQVHAPPGIGCNTPPFGRAPSDRRKHLPSSRHFHCLARSCADSDWRSSAHRGPWIALPAERLYYPVDMWPRSTTRGFPGDLEVLRERARAPGATAAVSNGLRFFACATCHLALFDLR